MLYPVSWILTLQGLMNFLRKHKIFWYILYELNIYLSTMSMCTVHQDYRIICYQDPTVLECAWMELSEKDKSITVEEFAEVSFFFDFLVFLLRTHIWFLWFSQIVYGNKESLESYCAHFLLSRDIVYFVKVESRDYFMYQPRSPPQVYFLNTCATYIMWIFRWFGKYYGASFILAPSHSAMSSWSCDQLQLWNFKSVGPPIVQLISIFL